MKLLRTILIKSTIVAIAASLLAGCALPELVSNSPALPGLSVSNPFIVEAPANSTATSTPFQPLPITATVLPTDWPTSTFTPIPTNTPIPPTPTPSPTPTVAGPVAIPKSWIDYPGWTVQPDIEVPAPVGILDQPKGQVNVLLLGSDLRPNDYGFRTDTIVLLTINPDLGTVNMTSFPRDLYVYIPGWTVQRINTAMPHGGFDLLAQTFEYNFGVHPDYYALINFGSFKEVIDSLGGVEVNVGVTFTDHRDGKGNYTVSAGSHHMDGEEALWYVRARYSTNDFDRGRRQQEVLIAIFNKMLSLNALKRIPQLFDIYKRNVQTNMGLELATTMIPMATKVSDTSRIHHYFISPQDVINYRTTAGAAVLLPIRSAVLTKMYQALNINP